MTEFRSYTYTSALAPYIEGFISEKRSFGYFFNGASYQLFRLDQYWKDHKYDDPCMTFEMLNEWLCAKPGEGKTGHRQRVCAARQLSIYMNTLGIPSYVPLLKIGTSHNKIHVLSHIELKELFYVIDHYQYTVLKF